MKDEWLHHKSKKEEVHWDFELIGVEAKVGTVGWESYEQFLNQTKERKFYT